MLGSPKSSLFFLLKNVCGLFFFCWCSPQINIFLFKQITDGKNVCAVYIEFVHTKQYVYGDMLLFLCVCVCVSVMCDVYGVMMRFSAIAWVSHLDIPMYGQISPQS